jgi:cytochrome b involved in lipid metabolism
MKKTALIVLVLVALGALVLRGQQVEAESDWKKHPFAMWPTTIYMNDGWVKRALIVKHHTTGACWIMLDGVRFESTAMAPAPKEVCQ